MKTADERAGIFVNMHTLTSGMSDDNKRIMVNAVSLLLKEQDKITRQLCAEEINNAPRALIPNGDCREYIQKQSAVSKIINTKAV